MRNVIRNAGRVVRTTVFTLIAAAAFANAAIAQNLSQSSIDGKVADEQGLALPGVTVTATSPALQVPQMVQVSDGEGRYKFPDLPRGVYTLKFDLQGFKTLVRAGLELTTGFAMRIDVGMAVGAMEESITVTGDAPLVDATSTRGGQTIDTELLVTVLPGNRTVADLVNMTPGLRNTDGENPGALGQNARPRFNQYGVGGGNTGMTMMIDGFAIIANNPVPDVGATAEVDVKTFGNTADIKENGAVMNMVLKSGGNQFHGSASAANMQQPDDNITDYLRGRNLAIGSKLKYFNDFSGDIGGRIIRDKLWFFTAARKRMNQVSQPGLVLDAGPDGKFQTGDEPAAFPKLHAENLTAKLTYQITGNYSLATALTLDRNVSEAELQGQSYAFVPFDSTGVLDWKPKTNKIEFKGTPSNSSVFSAQFGKSGYHIYRTYQPTCGDKPSGFDNVTQLYDGCRFNQFGDSNFNFWVGTANYSFIPGDFLGGRHEFKVGYNWAKRNNRGIRPNSPKGDYHLIFDTIGGVPHQALQIQLNNAPTAPVDWDVQNALYILDQFRIGDSLTLNLGLRYDRQDSYVPEQCREAGSFPIFPQQCFARVDVGTWNYWAPRVAGAWDMTGNGRTVVKATYGYFNPESSQASNYNLVSGYNDVYRWHDLNKNARYEPGEVDFNRNGPDFLSTGSTSTNEINPDLELTNVRETTVSFEHALTQTTAFRALYLYRVSNNQSSTVNVLRPYSAWNVPVERKDPGPDGVYNTADDGGFVTLYEYPASFAGAAFEKNVATNRPEGRGDHNSSFEFSMNKRSSRGWSLSGSYTATKLFAYTQAILINPNNERFPVNEQWQWSYKLSGNVTLPHEITFGGIVDVASGPRGTRTFQFRATDPLGGTRLRQVTSITLQMEEPNSQREKATPSVNIRAGKRLQLGTGRTANLSFDVLNLFNSSAIKAATYVSGQTFGTVTSIMTPRQYRLAASFTF